MREGISKRLLSCLEGHPSRIFDRIVLQLLLLGTADAFEKRGRLLLFCKDPLAVYGAFTKECMLKDKDSENEVAGSAASGRLVPSKRTERLYRTAYSLGEKVRRLSGLKDRKDLNRLIFLLYRSIGIRMEGCLPGEVKVHACYFSGIYTEEQCKVMSAMDAGIMAGILGKGTLAFSERITAGHGQCTACFACKKECGKAEKCEEAQKGKEISMPKRKRAVVIGTGAGGAMMAKELQGTYQVTILEAGGEFQPFSFPIQLLSKLRGTGLFFDERLIRLLLPNMIIDKTKDMVLVRGKGIGGTTTLATGNAVRYDGALKEIGIDLDEEFEELYQELPITTKHQDKWTDTTKKMFALFQEMGLDPVVTPKLMEESRCCGCGHCAIGCPTGAKWDTRSLINQAVQKGVRLIKGCRVTGLKIEDGRVTEVRAKLHGRPVRIRADLVVAAAGGLGTPKILKNSGIPCRESLFVDPVLCVAGELPGIRQDQQVLMPFISQQDGYILSPYMDYLSFFFDKRWRYPMKNIASIMIKLADEERGSVGSRHIKKEMSEVDQQHMDKAVEQARAILEKLGVPREKQFLGTLNAGHPGGMLPLTEAESTTLHPDVLPENLYVADATILPKAMGNPPILTIMALSKRIAKILKSGEDICV